MSFTRSLGWINGIVGKNEASSLTDYTLMMVITDVKHITKKKRRKKKSVGFLHDTKTLRSHGDTNSSCSAYLMLFRRGKIKVQEVVMLGRLTRLNNL